VSRDREGLILWTLDFNLFGHCSGAGDVASDFAYAQVAILRKMPQPTLLSALAAYQSTFSEDLADIRVFNAEGLPSRFRCPGRRTIGHSQGSHRSTTVPAPRGRRS